jgi:hypothetical protein
MDDYIFETRLAHAIAPPIFYNTSRLAPTDQLIKAVHEYDNPHYPWAVAKLPISKGDRIEVAPALVLDRDTIVKTQLAPLVYHWHDLNNELQASVQELRSLGYYVVQYQESSNGWRREDHFTSVEDTVILPFGGWIGRVQRVGGFSYDIGETATISDHLTATPNCKLLILPSDFYRMANTTADSNLSGEGQQTKKDKDNEQETNPFTSGNAGIVLMLMATRDVAVGERLRLDMAPSGTFKERLTLYKEMEQSGQVYTLPDHYDYHYLHPDGASNDPIVDDVYHYLHSDGATNDPIVDDIRGEL